MVFSKEDIAKIVNGETDDFEYVDDHRKGRSKRGTARALVFGHGGHLYATNYHRLPDGGIRLDNDADSVDCMEVHPFVMPNLVYLPAAPAIQELVVVVANDGPDTRLVDVEHGGKSVVPTDIRDRGDGYKELVFRHYIPDTP